MNGFERGCKQLRIVQKQFGGEHGFTTSQRADYHQTRWCIKWKSWTPFHDSMIGIAKVIIMFFEVHRVIFVEFGTRPQFIDELSHDPMVTPEKSVHVTITVTRQNTFQEGNQRIFLCFPGFGYLRHFLSTQLQKCREPMHFTPQHLGFN